MAHNTSTVNVALPSRRWTRPYAITLSNTVADRNLQRDGRPYRFIQNVGTAGLVMIAWEPDAAEVDIWMNAGEIIEGGYWIHAKTTGTVGTLRGFVGMEGRSD